MPVRIKVEGIFPPKNVMARKGDKVLMYIFTALETQVAATLKEGMEKRVKGWEGRPNFTSKIEDSGRRFSLLVEPSGRGKIKWVRVSGGTPPHTITARRKPTLAFRKYRPSTLPGNVYGRRHERYGEYFRPVSVRNPGIKPREFERHIAKEKEHLVFQILKIAATAGAKD